MQTIPSSSDWNKVLTANAIYLAKVAFPQNAGYCLLVSDLSNIWVCDAEESDILSLCQSLNPNVDAPLTTILQHFKTAFTDPDKVDASFRFNKCDVHELIMTSKLAGFPFKWNFFLEKDETGKLAENLTLPLMMLVAELRRQNDQLGKVIRKKDSEIDNYRMQGIKVTRKNLETKRFDVDQFADEMVASEAMEKEVRLLGLNGLSTGNQNLLAELLKKKRELETVSGPLVLVDAWGPPAGEVAVNSPLKVSAGMVAVAEKSEGEPEETVENRKRALEEKLEKEGQKMEETKRKKKKLKL